MDTKKVRAAPAGEESLIIGPLVLGFATDPIGRFIFRDANDFLRAFPKVVGIFAQPAIEAASAFYVETGGGSAAAAIWYPPGVSSDSEAMAGTLAEAVPASQLDERLGLFGAMEEAHPTEAHWYLPMIAADPTQQGQGHGSALLRKALERVDADHAPAYLESSNEANLPLYQRFGFEITGEIQSGSSPKLWPMWRSAR